MRKATKSQAKKAYDSFYGVLYCLNGGTSEENEKMAAACYERLKQELEKIKLLTTNPGKLLRGDSWLWESLTITIPNRVDSFAKKYNLQECSHN